MNVLLLKAHYIRRFQYILMLKSQTKNREIIFEKLNILIFVLPKNRILHYLEYKRDRRYQHFLSCFGVDN